jgi:hypothetical protein
VVVMNDDYEFDLMLEGLPADAGRLLGLPVLRKNDSAAVRLGAAGLAHTRDAEAGVASVRPQLISYCLGEARDGVAARPGEYYASMRRVWWHRRRPVRRGGFDQESKDDFWADDLAALPRENQADPPSLKPLSPLLPSFRFPPPSPCWNKDIRAAFLLVYVSLPYTLFYSAQFAIKTR